MKLGIAVVCAALLVGGCATKSDFQDLPTTRPTAAPLYVKPECSFTLNNTLLGTGGQPIPIGASGAFPPGFVPVAAVSCGRLEENVPGQGMWAVATQTKAEGSLDGLIAAYRTTSFREYVGTNAGCTDEMDFDPIIALIDAQGTAIVPKAPRDSKCNHVIPAVGKAVQALHWTVTKSVRVQQESTGGGCPASGYKDLLALQPVRTQRAPSGPFFHIVPNHLVVCVYKLTDAGLIPSGGFEREHDLSGADLAKVLAAFDAAPPAPADCTTLSTRFAVIGDLYLGDTYAELDGCRRLGTPDIDEPAAAYAPRQLDAATATLLGGIG